MNTRNLMTGSALVLAAAGLCASFLPQEIVASAGTPASSFNIILVQLAGALYLGFAMLNWMARGNLIGGIYSRPVAIANVAHFTIGALVLVKALLAGQRSGELVVAAAVYGAFAALFASVTFGRAPGAAR